MIYDYGLDQEMDRILDEQVYETEHAICKHCGRTYEIWESEAEMKEYFCCIACEHGY